MDTHDPSLLDTQLIQFIRDDIAPDADADIDSDTDLVMSGLVDSLGVVMIVEWLERRLDIVVDPGDVVIEHFSSVSAIVGYLAERHPRPAG